MGIGISWKKSGVVTVMLGWISIVPVYAEQFSSCDSASKFPKPEWVRKMDYSIPGYHTGVGSAEKSGKTTEEQRKISENDAKSHLAEEIEVTVHSQTDQSTQVKNNNVDKYASNSVTVIAQEVLRDLKIKDRWTDKDCTIYTLVIISNESVARAKFEKLMKTRLQDMKNLLEMGLNKDKIRAPKARQQYLEEAQIIFNEIDFTVLNEAYSKSVYMKKITDTLLSVRNEISQSQGRIALFAINPDGKIPSEVIGKMLDQLRAGNTKADRLMVSCTALNECLDKAKERGFEVLAWLKIDGRVEVSNMGALKGTVSVSKTLYDVTNRKVVDKGSNGSAQVIGWGNDEVNWESAAEKAMQELH